MTARNWRCVNCCYLNDETARVCARCEPSVALRAANERQAREIAEAKRSEEHTRAVLRVAERDYKERLASAEAERDALREELASVLTDWNAIVRASGSPTNGGAVGHVIAMRAERDALRGCVRDMLAAIEPVVPYTSAATQIKFAEVLDAARAKVEPW